MSLLNTIAKVYAVSSVEVNNIMSMDDSQLEWYIENLSYTTKQQRCPHRYTELYRLALNEAERRLSMQGARDRFKQEKYEKF